MSAAEAAADPNGNTIDNDGTTLPMEFLARMVLPTGDARYRAAFERGVDYLLAAQYPNGGWPQFFPLREGYYSRITYNDNAMIRVLTLLRDVAAGTPHYAFVDAGRRAKAGAAVARGLDVILRTQLKQGGALTAWCAQYDERTLEPAWARNYEPPTLSGSESVGIVRYLMEVDQPTPEVAAAVEGAVAWLKSVAIEGLRYEEVTLADGTRDRRVVADPSAPPLWARFYDLGTNRPIFTGRDKVDPLRAQRNRAGAPQRLRLLRHMAGVAPCDGLPALARASEAALATRLDTPIGADIIGAGAYPHDRPPASSSCCSAR